MDLAIFNALCGQGLNKLCTNTPVSINVCRFQSSFFKWFICIHKVHFNDDTFCTLSCYKCEHESRCIIRHFLFSYIFFYYSTMYRYMYFCADRRIQLLL